MEPLISIIIPVYNTEKYLKCCIESVRKQSYRNIEIILVNDGSTDQCARICNEYAQYDNRIRVIHKNNKGLAEARNDGIKCSRGSYLAFIDSDDFIHRQYIEVLYENCRKYESEIAILDYERVDCDAADENYVVQKLKKYTTECVSGKAANYRIYEYEYYVKTIMACAKLIKKELFNGICFPPGRIHEDEATIYKLLYNAKKVVYINLKLYFYRRNPNGIMLSEFSEKRLQLIDALEERLQFYEEHKEKKGGKDLYNLTLDYEYSVLHQFYCKLKFHMNNSEILQEKLRKKQKQIYLILIKEQGFRLKRKIKYTLALFLPVTFFKIYYRK